MITDTQKDKQENQDKQTLFQSQLQAFYADIEESDALSRYRLKAWEHFLQIGLPTRRTDTYRYFPLNKFYDQSCYDPSKCNLKQQVSKETIASYLLPECQGSCLVFINGLFSLDKSFLQNLPTNLVILPIDEAMKTFQTHIISQWAKSIKEELDPFAALNLALHRNGLYLYVPPNVEIKTPIQLLYLTNINEPDALLMRPLLMPRVQGFIGRGATLNLVSTHETISNASNNFNGNFNGVIFNGILDLAIEENGSVYYTQSSPKPSGSWHFDATRIVMKKDSKFTSVMASQGSVSHRHDYSASLIGENVDLHLNGISYLQKNNKSHVNVLVNHEAPHCTSLQLFKSAIADSAHAAFEGKIFVKRAAQKTEAFQLNNNLLLSDFAHADSKPNLEIFADDVKASHGSTIGQLDEEQIFYMRTRGFSTATAKSLLVKGFCEEVICKIPIDSLRKSLLQQFDEN